MKPTTSNVTKEVKTFIQQFPDTDIIAVCSVSIDNKVFVKYLVSCSQDEPDEQMFKMNLLNELSSKIQKWCDKNNYQLWSY